MPVRDFAPVGAPCWIELFTSDVARAKDFYGQLFGWNWTSPGEDFGGYFNFTKDEHMVAGCMGNDGSTGMGDVWSVYLASADNEAIAAVVPTHGGHVHLPPHQVADLGNMCMMNDAGGAWLGAWQPGVHAGIGLLGEIGTPSWFELHTRDYAASLAFYRAVFGWDIHTVSDDDAFRYSTMNAAGAELAGVMDAAAWLPDGVPSHWATYFRVADTDATIAQLVALGGTVVLPAEDTPYGRIAQVADPTGAGFRLQAV